MIVRPGRHDSYCKNRFPCEFLDNRPNELIETDIKARNIPVSIGRTLRPKTSICEVFWNGHRSAQRPPECSWGFSLYNAQIDCSTRYDTIAFIHLYIMYNCALLFHLTSFSLCFTPNSWSHGTRGKRVYFALSIFDSTFFHLLIFYIKTSVYWNGLHLATRAINAKQG